MGTPFHLRVLTAEKTVLEAEVEALIARGRDGFIGILAHHAALVTELVPGPLVLRRRERGPQGGTGASGEIITETLVVSGGFLEVAANRAVVLADAVERPEEIDVARARDAEERARRRLAERAADLDEARARAALQRALNRKNQAAARPAPRDAAAAAQGECRASGPSGPSGAGGGDPATGRKP